MSWLEDLAAKIEALKDEDFRPCYITADGLHKVVYQAKIEVPFNFTHYDYTGAVGYINSRPVGNADRGFVMFGGLSYYPEGGKAYFHVRKNISWNSGMPTDSAGQKPYREVDFNTLLCSLRSSRPG
jgi:hypothetical protein